MLESRVISIINVALDNSNEVSPDVLEVLPRIELVAIGPRYGGQRIGQNLIRTAEAYCVAQHRRDARQRPWSAGHVSKIVGEGFEPDELLMGLDTIWAAHTGYYGTQGYHICAHQVHQAQYALESHERRLGEIVIMQSSKRLPV